jgi:hypothetical protein
MCTPKWIEFRVEDPGQRGIAGPESAQVDHDQHNGQPCVPGLAHGIRPVVKMNREILKNFKNLNLKILAKKFLLSFNYE